MQYLLILLLISTAVFSWFFNFKGKFGAVKLVQYLLSLFAVCTFFQTMNLLTSEASLFLLSLLTVNFGLSFIKKLANTKFHLPLVVLSYGIVLLFENPTLRFGEYEINFKSYESALIFIVSALLSLIVTWKTKFLGKFFHDPSL